MVERKIIFKCRIGSHLFGTNRPDSDEDYAGIFLPSTEDLLSLQKCPDEWTENVKLSDGARNAAGDIDCKYFALQKFLRLAGEGQPQQLEMLFAPDNMVLISTPEWEEIKKNKENFISKKSITPFIGFSLSQAYKATIKGDNLAAIRNLIKIVSNLPDPQAPISFYFNPQFKKGEVMKSTNIGEQQIEIGTNEQGFTVATIAGRSYDINLKTKTFLKNLEELEKRYGTRSQAAAEKGYDYKSLGHAVRLLGEATEFLSTGVITLPRPDADYLKTILTGKMDEETDWFDMLNKKIDYIRQELVPKSTFPEKARWSKLDKLCIKMLTEHLSNL